jgi:hypothetical protein
MRRRIGWDSLLSPDCPRKAREGEIRLTSGFHNLVSKERIEEVTETENEIDRVSSVMCRNRFG